MEVGAVYLLLYICSIGVSKVTQKLQTNFQKKNPQTIISIYKIVPLCCTVILTLKLPAKNLTMLWHNCLVAQFKVGAGQCRQSSGR